MYSAVLARGPNPENISKIIFMIFYAILHNVYPFYITLFYFLKFLSNLLESIYI